MKETVTPAASQTKRLGNYLLAESTSDRSILIRTVLWIWKYLLPREADCPAVPPRVLSGYLRVAHQIEKSKRPGWHLVRLMLCLILVGPSLAAPFMMSQTAWAAPSHLAHQQSVATHLISQRPYCPVGVPGSVCDLADGIDAFIGVIKALFQVLAAFFNNNPVGWIECILTAGTVACPTLSNVAPWAFDCPVDMAGFESTAANAPGVNAASSAANQAVTTANGSADSSSILVGGPAGGAVGDPGPIDVGKKLTIYQTALQQANTGSQADWLSGDGQESDTSASSLASEPGHLTYTYTADTFQRKGMPMLNSISLGVGFLLIGPLFILVAFQFLLAGLKGGSEKAIANALEGLGRVLLAGAMIGLSFSVVQILMAFLNQANSAVIQLHQTLGYPQTKIDNAYAVSYSAPGDSPQSFRGLVMPMDLWGCVMDDFLGLMASRLANAIGSGIPVIGGIFGLTGRIREIGDLINDLGEFGLLIVSVTIWGQAIARIVLINYYILLAPVAFACWGLPGQLGTQTIKAWFKGLLQLLFVQTLQIFILTTMPSLLPDFGLMHFPQGGSISNPPLQSFLVQLPPIITGFAAVGAPKVLMGMGPMRTMAQAGAIAGKAVAAAGAAISSAIKKK